jgi:hypothetical protein
MTTERRRPHFAGQEIPLEPERNPRPAADHPLCAESDDAMSDRTGPIFVLRLQLPAAPMAFMAFAGC